MDVGSAVKCVSGWAVDILKMVLFAIGYDCVGTGLVFAHHLRFGTYDDMSSFTDPSITRLAVDQGKQFWVIEYLFSVNQDSIGSLSSVFNCVGAYQPGPEQNARTYCGPPFPAS